MLKEPPVIKEGSGEPPEPFMTLDFERILDASDQLPGYITKAVLMIKKNTYLTMEDYFSALTDYEVVELFFLTSALVKAAFVLEGADEALLKKFRHFSLLATILLHAEGETFITATHLLTAVPNLALMSAAESRYRTGGIYTNRKLYSVSVNTDQLQRALSNASPT